MSYSEPELLIDPTNPFSAFLLERLGIPAVKIAISTRPGIVPREISFQEYMRVFYMDQTNSFQKILHNVLPEWLKAKLIQILLGMSKEEVEALNNRIQELTNFIKKLDDEIVSIRSFLQRSGYTNPTDAQRQRVDILEALQVAQADINAVKRNMRGQGGITDELRRELDRINLALAQLEAERAKTEYRIRDFELLLNSLRTDKDRIWKASTATHVLSSVEFVQCPRCLQRISAEMRSRENEGVALCMLCSRPLSSSHPSTRVVRPEIELDEEVKEVQILLEKYSGDMSDMNERLVTINSRKAALQARLDDLSRSYVSPFIDELERLFQVQNQLRTNGELIEQQLRMWELLQKRETELFEHKLEQSKLRAMVLSIDTSDDTKVQRLSEIYEAFLRGIDYENLATVKISSNDFMPYINGHLYTEDTGSGIVAMKVVAYHYSLLEFSLRNPCYYPRFLMLDSPRAFDVNPETYSRMMLQFKALQDASGQIGFQTIITTRDLPAEMEELVIERLNKRNRMLLRAEGRREQSTSL